MPLFYFDVRDGDDFVSDDVGLELPNIARARDEAARALADMAKDALRGSGGREMSIEIRDEAKEPLLQTLLRFEVQRLR